MAIEWNEYKDRTSCSDAGGYLLHESKTYGLLWHVKRKHLLLYQNSNNIYGLQ